MSGRRRILRARRSRKSSSRTQGVSSTRCEQSSRPFCLQDFIQRGSYRLHTQNYSQETLRKLRSTMGRHHYERIERLETYRAKGTHQQKSHADGDRIFRYDGSSTRGKRISATFYGVCPIRKRTRCNCSGCRG